MESIFKAFFLSFFQYIRMLIHNVNNSSWNHTVFEALLTQKTWIILIC